MAQEKKLTGQDQYRFLVTTHDDLWLENAVIESSSVFTAIDQLAEQISAPEYVSLNGRGCKWQLTGVNVDENEVQH